MSDEKIIQIVENKNYMHVLTNQGRIFGLSYEHNEWFDVELPPLNKTKPRSQAKEYRYTDEFNQFWSIYPKGHGGSKKEALRQWVARLMEVNGIHDEVMIAGAKRYAAFIKATGQHVKHPATFLGRDKHYLNDFTIPDSAKRQNRVKQDWEFIPENDHLVFDWAKKHGFKVDGLDKIFDTRRKLQTQIKERIESGL